MNRTIKDATVKRYFYETHDRLRTHLRDFVDAYNFGRRLKTLNGLTPFEFLCMIPCVRIDHLSPDDQRLLRLASNRLAEKGEWDPNALKLEFEELILVGTPIETSGFAVDEVVLGEGALAAGQGPLVPETGAAPVSRPGDVFALGPHRVVCRDAADPAVLARLTEGDAPARQVLTDEPYNVKIAGNVSGAGHREFAMASGEMTDAQFLAFNEAWMAAVLLYLCDGGIFGTFIDWRGLPIVDSAAAKLGLGPLNLIVWAKTNAGMGSLYRSQHELLPLFNKGSAPHVNNVNSASAAAGAQTCGPIRAWLRRAARFTGPPTVKPTAMLEDALLDLTNRGDIVIDPFLGSGSTMIAAEKTGRVCRGVELDPLYVDVIIRRYEASTGNQAVLVVTDEKTFAALTARRATEAAPI